MPFSGKQLKHPLSMKRLCAGWLRLSICLLLVAIVVSVTPSALADKNAKAPAPIFVRDKWAVVIGLSKYQDSTIEPVKYTTANIAALSRTLKDPNAGRFALDHVATLYDTKATQAHIEDVMSESWLMKKALPQDFILIYICGRAIFSDKDAVLYAFDTPKNAPNNTGISLNSLLSELHRRTQCKNILCLFDLVPASNESSSQTIQLWPKMANDAKVAVLAANLAGEPSYQSGFTGTSLFTNYLVEGMQAGGGFITLDAIAQFIQQNAQTEARNQLHKDQHPQYVLPVQNIEMGSLIPGIVSKFAASQKPINIGHPLDRLALTRPDLIPRGPNRQLSQKVAAKTEEDDDDKDDSATGMGNIDFGPYMTKMKKDIQSKWKPPVGLEQRKVAVVFSIYRDGTIAETNIVDSSGVESVDQSALEALKEASPLDRLPPGAPHSVRIRYQFDWKVSH